MNTKYLNRIEILLIVLFAIIPLFISLPYRINIFLSWEGAYRVSEGQLPFRDFGTPIGGVYWLVPAIFFKIFGAQMISLIKAQVFLNIISGLSFRYILKKLEFDAYARFLALIVFIISFSFINFWPWYNHTVIVYELVALAFLLKYIYAPGLAAALTDRKWKGLLVYVGALGIFLTAYILLTSAQGFGYWFNHGQAPHSSRVHLIDFFEEFFGGSHWLKFYLLLIVLLSVPHLQQWKQNISNKKIIIPFLLTLGILVEALLFSVTSYVPPDNNIFFHSFAVAFILNRMLALVPSVNNRTGFYVAAVLVLLWWSPNYWRYMQVIVRPFTKAAPTASTENVVDRNTYKISAPDSSIPIHEWKK
ncbi:MAG: hypothetical protein EOO03_14455 [Chitinophagaceae bacterium]|nr:MAG: hypothetical protein EOO03_14455 [Chitinophagaceae bacterium]